MNKNKIKQSDELILTGKLKMFPVVGTSINGDDFVRVPMTITETLISKNGAKIDNPFSSTMLVFWKKSFNPTQNQEISNLKEGQELNLKGMVGGRDNGIFRVLEYEVINKEGDIFI